jgi:AbrB family looped-hinge helix DNA binding protein
MSKVTSKLQVTIPRAVAVQYGIEPGDEVEFIPAGDSIRVVPLSAAAEPPDVARRLQLFDQATARQRARQRGAKRAGVKTRGWKREELYERGGTG